MSMSATDWQVGDAEYYAAVVLGIIRRDCRPCMGIGRVMGLVGEDGWSGRQLLTPLLGRASEQ